MFILPGYEVHEQIHEDNKKNIYRGYSTKDCIPVIIKILKREAANPNEISRLIHGYEISKNLDIEGIIKPIRFEQEGPLFALVMEDMGAVSLREYIHGRLVNLPDFLHIAARLAEVLDRIHKKGIIHRDLKPKNILINPNTEKIYINDFSSAVLSSAKTNTKTNNSLVFSNPSGTLEYMSPEQTGRLNTAIDERSDLYSLGAVFYEIMAGRLPFQADNPAEWVYAHITRIPESPDKINSHVPPVISQIIMKLLAKAAEDRYQSACGLLHDLRECERQLVQKGRIELFPIGRRDVSSCFRLPNKLYGREAEMEALRAAFERACKGRAETILVSGYPGIGKTRLIDEALRPVAFEKGCFITGKFDQLRQNIPYYPLAAAFGNLIKQLMTGSREDMDLWRKRILGALGRSGTVITNIIPELECIIGKQPPVDTLSLKEAENRFLMVFRDFISLFSWNGHPLVLFLDDLQWADAASVDLLKYLTRDAGLNSLLFIGAFRENEIDEGHPLNGLLEEIHKEEPNIKHISLMPLEKDRAADLVTETLHAEPENVGYLSEVLYSKSGGNPFFLRQLLMLIHDEEFIYFDAQEGRWRWELEAIQKLQPGEDVLELLLKKLQRLPEKAREIMKLAACIGNRFDIETLAAVYGKSQEETASCLMPSVLEGFILMPVSQKEKPSPVYPETKPSVFEFLHDRVQQAAYSLITEDDKKQKHYAIGRLLLQNTVCSNLEEKILPIMDHFNRSLELIYDPAERMELAGYNLMAGRRSKASAAYASALQYFRSGVELLPDDPWEHDYRLSYDLHLELAQAEYLSANADTSEKLFGTVIEKSVTELERASVYGLKVILYAGMGKYTEAVQTGIRALANFGIRIPAQPSKLDYARELLLFKWYMRNKRIEDLEYLPDMKDPVQRSIAELLTRLSSVTMTSYPDLYSFIILKTGNYTVRYGNTEMTPVGYFGYGITTGSILGDYKAGYRYGRVCINLVEKYGRSSSRCIIYFVIGAFISHWTSHAALGLEYLKKAALSGMEAGDILIIGYAHCLLLETKYLLGTSLDDIKGEIHKKHEIARRLSHDNLALNAEIYEKTVSALRGDSLAAGAAEFEQDEFQQLVQNDQSSLATYYFYKMQIYYMTGNYRDALSAAQSIEPLSGAVLGFMISVECNFYHSLAITALYDEMSFRDRRRHLKTLKKNLRQMKRWSEACRENYEHKFLLIAAETARLSNRNEEVMPLYDHAIRSARENGYIQNEALANELAARFYLSQGMSKIARTYLSDACRGYNRWGAIAKVRELKDRYPELLDGMNFEEQKADTAEVFEKMAGIAGPADVEAASSLDMYFVDKAVQNISTETDIDKLLENFLEIAVQSIGADRGHIILEKGGDLFVEATKDSNLSETIVKTIPLEKCNNLSKAVVRYVVRTLETIVLNCGETAGFFDGDPYIAESNTRSIACLPLLFQGTPFGVLYFENSFIPGVFTPDRLELLKIFSTQIACIKKLQSYSEEGTAKAEEEACPYFIDHLTERETEVLNLIAKGMSNKEIADSLEITLNTVKGYIKNIYIKLEVNRRVQVVARAKELKLLKN